MSNVDDHGLEVIKKAAEYTEPLSPSPKKDYYLKVGGAPTGSSYTIPPVNVSQTPGDVWDVNATVVVEGDSISSGTVDGTPSGTERTFVNNRKNQVLAAHDLIISYSWLNFGTKDERIDSITYTSNTFPGISVLRSFSYTLVGTKYRLDSESWTTTPGG